MTCNFLGRLGKNQSAFELQGEFVYSEDQHSIGSPVNNHLHYADSHVQSDYSIISSLGYAANFDKSADINSRGSLKISADEETLLSN